MNTVLVVFSNLILAIFFALMASFLLNHFRRASDFEATSTIALIAGIFSTLATIAFLVVMFLGLVGRLPS